MVRSRAFSLVSAFLVAACADREAGEGADAAVRVDTGSVSVNDTRLSYEIRGEGPAVVLIHGGGFDRRMWDDQVPDLARDFRVIRYDVRGAGQSASAEGQTFEHHEDLAALLRHLTVSGASIVGQSLGGRIAMDLALAHPDMVDRLVLVGPGVSGWPWSRKDFGDWIDTMSAGLTRKDTTQVVAGWLSSDYMKSVMERPGVSDRVRQFATENARMWFENSTDEELSPPAIGRLKAITSRTLIILGSRDERVIHRIVDSLMPGLPNARLTRMEGLGHAPNLEEPARFNELVIGFLRDTTR